MFSLFFTIPADRNGKKIKGHQQNIPSRKRSVIAWCLLAIWLTLISFAVISILNPKWLQDLARLGVKAESRDYKKFGDDFLLEGNIPMALAQYQRALEIKPDYADAMVNMAIAYSRIGDGDRGIQLLNRASRYEVSNKSAIYYTLAEIYEKQKRFDESIRYCLEALDSDPENYMIYRKLGTSYFAQKEYEKAKIAFENSLIRQIDPCLSYREMLKESLSDFIDDTVHIRIIESELTRDIGTDDLAAYDLVTICGIQKNDPEISKTHNHLGVIYAIQGNYTQAVVHFQESHEIWPGNMEAVQNLKIMQQRVGSHSQSTESDRIKQSK